MREYLLKVTVPAGETRVFPIPSQGIGGVYSTTAVTLKWDYNGNIGILGAMSLWEPIDGFHPALTSSLIIENTAATSAEVSIRCFGE